MRGMLGVWTTLLSVGVPGLAFGEARMIDFNHRIDRIAISCV
jgi:hypothetical protein